MYFSAMECLFLAKERYSTYEKVFLKGKLFFMGKTIVPARKAQLYCKSNHASLATIKSKEEFQTLADLLGM